MNKKCKPTAPSAPPIQIVNTEEKFNTIH